MTASKTLVSALALPSKGTDFISSTRLANSSLSIPLVLVRMEVVVLRNVDSIELYSENSGTSSSYVWSPSNILLKSEKETIFLIDWIFLQYYISNHFQSALSLFTRIIA